MAESVWPFVFGRLRVGPMPRVTRAEHVRKHLLNPAEAWWEVCTLRRREIEALAQASPAEPQLRELYTSDYEPVFRTVLERFAHREAPIEVAPDPERKAFGLFDTEWGVKLIAARSPEAPEAHPWPVLTAYRPQPFAGTEKHHRQRQGIRSARRAASLGQCLTGYEGELP